jgi:hypothetical protein
MRNLRIALVILLLLTFSMASQAMAATVSLSPQSMGDALSIAKSRATLQNIEKKLASGSSDIQMAGQELSAYTKLMAGKSIANVTKMPGTNKTSNPVKTPSMEGYGVPMSGIGNAVKALGSIHMKIKAPVEIAKSIGTPRLEVMP